MSYNRSTPETSDEDLDMCRKGWNSNSESDSDSDDDGDDNRGFVVLNERQNRSQGGEEEQFRDLFDKLRSTRSSNSGSTKNLNHNHNHTAAETATSETRADGKNRDRDRRHIQDLSMDLDDDDDESSSSEEEEASRGVYEEVSLAASKDAFQEYEEVTLGSKDALRDAPSGVYEEVSTSSSNNASQNDDSDPSSTRGSSLAEEAAGIRSETDSYTDCTDTHTASPTSNHADPSNNSSSTGSTQPHYQYTQQEMLILGENQRLKKEVYRLREEAREKDALISTLESQIMALVVAGREDTTNQRLISSDEENDSDTESDIESVADADDADADVNETEATKRIANRTCMEPTHHPKQKPKQKQKQSQQQNQNQNNNNNARSHPKRIMSTNTSASSASPSLIAPPRRSSIEMKHPPAPYPEPRKKISMTPSTTLVSRKTRFQKSTAAIKALPRELSISNHSSRLFDDDDDDDEYGHAYVRKSRRKNRRKSGEGDSSNEHYEVTNMEFMDAYNSRGIYTGTVQKATQMPHGKGKMVYHKGGRVGGRFYDGDWHVGHWHGYAILRDANGDIYEGQVVNDLKEGMGTIQFMDGRIFQGRFQQDEASEGTMSYIDGAQYEGELHHGNRHGYGIYRFSDGSYYKGESVMNLFEGRGKMTWSDGGWYEGDWSKGEIHGFGKEYRPDGTLRHDGKWIKGVPIRIKNIHNGRR